MSANNLKVTRYQYDGKTLKATCIYCKKDYSEHKGLELYCPKYKVVRVPINKNMVTKKIKGADK